MPLIFGVLSIPLVGILSYQVEKNNSFLLTILLVSINIYLIKYSQETRTYTLVFLLSTINLIFYYKTIFSDLTYFKKIYIFSLFVIFSVLGLSAHPFVFIIFFSQIAYSVYSIFVFREKNFLFVLSIPFILIIYLVINYNYLISQFSYNEYFLEHENWKFYFDYYFSRFFGSKIMGLIYLSILIFLIIRFRKMILFTSNNYLISQLSYNEYFLEYENWKFYYNYYFSRFFGSKIMGLIYLSTLFFLIIRFRKKILFTSNNYLPLIFILFFSYLIPLFYALLKTPILTDRYIIFVLIPIFILISTLIFEIDNKKLKIFLLISILIPTIINNYIEIQFRKNSKPEFTKLLGNLKKHETKNLYFYAPKVIDKIIENYIQSLNVFKNNNFKILNINNISSDINKLWVICYEPVMGYNCNIPTDIQKSWTLYESEKLHLLNVQLYGIRN